MAKNDCFVYYIIATMLDGTKKVHSFPHVIGTNCSYKYVNMKGEVLDLSKFTPRTKHLDSSPDPTLGNVIHETKELKSCGNKFVGMQASKISTYIPPQQNTVCSINGNSGQEICENLYYKSTTSTKYYTCVWNEWKNSAGGANYTCDTAKIDPMPTMGGGILESATQCTPPSL